MRSLRETLGPFVRHLAEQRGRLLAAYSLTLLWVSLNMLLPWPLKFLIDDVLTGKAPLPILAGTSTSAKILGASASIALLALLSAVTLSNEKVLHARIREQFGLALRDRLISKIYGLSFVVRQAEYSGELTMRLVSDSQLVSRLLCKTAPSALKNLSLVVFVLVAVAWIDWRMGVLAVVIVAVMSAIVVYYAPRLRRAAKTKRRCEGQVAALTQETIAGIEHIQAMALEAQARKRYLKSASKSLSAGVEEIRVAVHMERSAQIFAGLATALVAGAGGLLVASGQLSLGTLTVCITYITQLLKPVERLNEMASNVSSGLVRADRLVELLDAPAAIETSLVGEEIVAVDAITFDEVTYCYPSSITATIQNLSHVFRRGECTVLTGASGSGKTTILRLLLRLISPTQGELLANGMDYRNIDPTGLRSNFAVLMQSAHLFSGTVREVVSELCPHVEDNEIHRVLRRVHLTSLINNLPDGLDTRLDEFGDRVSGGQRTRLLLARVILSGRPVLVLDEPLANIDEMSRKVVVEALRAIKVDRILICVSHHDALLEIADHVLTPQGWQQLQEQPHVAVS